MALLKLKKILAKPLGVQDAIMDLYKRFQALEREPGPKGEKGEPGKDGRSIVGPQGPKGEDGKSIVGQEGPRGPMGPRGPEGAQGPKGEDGAPGLDGRDGKDGKDGLNGRDGKDGEPGPIGPMPEHEIEDAKLRFQLPNGWGDWIDFKKITQLRGPRGLPGERGEPGPQGPAGASGGAPFLGWIFLQDSQYSSGSPMAVDAGVKTKITNDGLGPLTFSTFGSEGYEDWYDETNSKVFANELGELFVYRLNIRIVPSLNNQAFVFAFDVGAPNPLWSTTVQLARGAGVATQLSFSIPIGAGNSMMSGGGGFYITPECACDIYGATLLIERGFKP